MQKIRPRVSKCKKSAHVFQNAKKLPKGRDSLQTT
jgi:hypothetical protein